MLGTEKHRNYQVNSDSQRQNGSGNQDLGYANTNEESYGQMAVIRKKKILHSRLVSVIIINIRK